MLRRTRRPAAAIASCESGASSTFGVRGSKRWAACLCLCHWRRRRAVGVRHAVVVPEARRQESMAGSGRGAILVGADVGLDVLAQGRVDALLPIVALGLEPCKDISVYGDRDIDNYRDIFRDGLAPVRPLEELP